VAFGVAPGTGPSSVGGIISGGSPSTGASTSGGDTDTSLIPNIPALSVTPLPPITLPTGPTSTDVPGGSTTAGGFTPTFPGPPSTDTTPGTPSDISLLDTPPTLD